MNKNELEQIIFRLLESTGEKTERGLSLRFRKNPNYFNSCKMRGEIRLKTLIDICKEHDIDYNYIYSGVRSDRVVTLKDDEMVIKKSDWQNLQTRLQLAIEIAMGKSAEHQEGIGDPGKSGVVAGTKRTAKSHDPP